MQQAAAQPENTAGRVERNLHGPVLVSFLDGAEEMLAPILDPFHRAAEQLGGRGYGDVFGVDAKLRTEAAADIGRRNAQAVLIDTERRGERIEEIVRFLGRGIHGQRAVRPAVFDSDATTFDRVRRTAMGPKALAKNMGGVRECGIDVAITEAV